MKLYPKPDVYKEMFVLDNDIYIEKLDGSCLKSYRSETIIPTLSSKNCLYEKISKKQFKVAKALALPKIKDKVKRAVQLTLF